MHPSARPSAPLRPIVVSGAVLYLLAPLASAVGITGPVVLGRPIVWLGLQSLGWVTVAVVLFGSQRHAADQVRLADEAERLNRSIAACATSFELSRAAPGPDAPEFDRARLRAVVGELDDLLVILREAEAPTRERR